MKDMKSHEGGIRGRGFNPAFVRVFRVSVVNGLWIVICDTGKSRALEPRKLRNNTKRGPLLSIAKHFTVPDLSARSQRDMPRSRGTVAFQELSCPLCPFRVACVGDCR